MKIQNEINKNQVTDRIMNKDLLSKVKEEIRFINTIINCKKDYLGYSTSKDYLLKDTLDETLKEKMK